MHVKRISVENREVDKDFGQVCDSWIMKMKITADGEKLLVGDNGGNLKLISSRDGKVIKDLGKVHDGSITGIVITGDQNFWLTSSDDGGLKQFNYCQPSISVHSISVQQWEFFRKRAGIVHTMPIWGQKTGLLHTYRINFPPTRKSSRLWFLMMKFLKANIN